MSTIHIPWYATVFRADAFAAALQEIVPTSLRYGADKYFVYRGGDDTYRFSTYFVFADKTDWERYWYGPEFNAWREKHASWFQIPVVYDVGTTLAEGRSELAAEI
jgi:hypothetical protein